MSSTSIADHATLVNGVTTSGAEARVQGGETDLPKLPLTTGGSKKYKKSKISKKSKKYKKSQSKKRKTKSRRTFKK